MPRTTIRCARTWLWARTRPWVGQSSALASLSLSQSCLGCTTITSGYDFRKGQGHMSKCEFVQTNIGQAEPVPGEHALGWTFHYVIGIAYGLLLVAIWGAGWLRQPGIAEPLILALALLVLQPARQGKSSRPEKEAPRSIMTITHATNHHSKPQCRAH